MTKFLVAVVFLCISFSSFPYDLTPDIDVAPGDLCTRNNKDFDGYRYNERIAHCKRRVSKSTKKKVCARQGVSDSERRKYYTVDHIIPLSIGGSNSMKNLWCQHRDIHTGNLEFWVYNQLKDGSMTHAESIEYILDYKFNQ